MSTMRIFKTLPFERFARKEKITNKTLKDSIDEIERGIVDADLGGGIIKQRIARKGQGKSSGYRIIIAIKKADKAFLIHGFAKSNKADIDKGELTAFKEAAKTYLALSDQQIQQLIDNKQFKEVK